MILGFKRILIPILLLGVSGCVAPGAYPPARSSVIFSDRGYVPPPYYGPPPGFYRGPPAYARPYYGPHRGRIYGPGGQFRGRIYDYPDGRREYRTPGGRLLGREYYR